MEPYLVFLIIAAGLFLLGCLWEWLQGTAAYAGSDSGGEALWMLSGIAMMLAVATNLVLFAVFTVVVVLAVATAVVQLVRSY